MLRFIKKNWEYSSSMNIPMITCGPSSKWHSIPCQFLEDIPNQFLQPQNIWFVICITLLLVVQPLQLLNIATTTKPLFSKREHPQEQGCKSNGRGVMEGYKRGAVTYPWIQRMVRWWAKRWVFPFQQGYHMRVLNCKEKRERNIWNYVTMVTARMEVYKWW